MWIDDMIVGLCVEIDNDLDIAETSAKITIFAHIW